MVQSVCCAACGIFWDDQRGNAGSHYLSPAFLNVCEKDKCGRGTSGTTHAAGQTEGARKKFHQHIFCEQEIESECKKKGVS